jgi:hypothetical protein
MSSHSIWFPLLTYCCCLAICLAIYYARNISTSLHNKLRFDPPKGHLQVLTLGVCDAKYFVRQKKRQNFEQLHVRHNLRNELKTFLQIHDAKYCARNNLCLLVAQYFCIRK